MRKLLLLPFVLLGFAVTARAQTVAVSGSFKSSVAANVPGLAGVNYLKIRLRNFAGNPPRLTSTGVIAQPEVDVVPDASGDVATTVYGNDDLSPDGTYYSFDFYVGGRLRTTTNFAICRAVAENGCSGFSASFDFNSAAPLSTAPVVLPGGGDSTYLRLDGGNTMAGNLSFGGAGIVATTGRERLLSGDAICWRNSGNDFNYCLTMGGSAWTFSSQGATDGGLGASLFQATQGSGNTSTSGVIRLRRDNAICWRNQADDDNLCLTKDTNNNIAFPTGLAGTEMSDPAAPSANQGVLYFRDNGSGKTQLVVRFPTGNVQVIATEP
jgi:hypothetical protein